MGILIVSTLVLVSSLCAVYYWRKYWTTVFADAWSLVESLSGGTKISLAAGAALPVILVLFRWMFTRRDEALKHEFVQEVIKPGVATVMVYLCVLAFYTIFIAQPKMYTKKAGEAARAINDLAKLTPPGADTSYRVLADKLAESEGRFESEKNARKQAEDQAEQYRQQRLEWLFAYTNTTSTLIPFLDDAIAATQRDRDANKSLSVESVMQRDAEIKKLQERRETERVKDMHSNYPVLLLYAVSEYQKRFSDSVNKCGNLGAFPAIPSLEWWIGSGQTTNFISTNCGVRFEYQFQSRPGGGSEPRTEILVDAKKKASAHVDFISSGGTFHSRIYIGDDFVQFKRSKIRDLTNCIKDVDYVLDLFYKYKKEEFE